jgi:hypothetical protein
MTDAVVETGRHFAVAYHFPCPDGVFGALAAHLYFVDAGKLPEGAKLSFVPQRVELSPSAVDATVTDVYMIDWIGSAKNVVRWAESAATVTLLDHHKTSIDELAALKALPSNVVDLCDLEHSGATLAWNHFFALLEDEPELRDRVFTRELHELFLLVEDRDLWRCAMPDSKAVSTGMASYQMNYDARSNPDIFKHLLTLRIDPMREAGLRELVATEAAVKAELLGAFVVRLGNGALPFPVDECLAVVTAKNKHLRSEIGNELARMSKERGLAAMGAVAYVETALQSDAELLKVSLRSLGDLDTTPISKFYNGGGHANASSFNVHTKHFNRWRRAPKV